MGVMIVIQIVPQTNMLIKPDMELQLNLVQLVPLVKLQHKEVRMLVIALYLVVVVTLLLVIALQERLRMRALV